MQRSERGEFSSNENTGRVISWKTFSRRDSGATICNDTLMFGSRRAEIGHSQQTGIDCGRMLDFKSSADSATF